MRLPNPVTAAVAALLIANSGIGTASAGVAVVIDRDALELVAAGSNECPSRRVIFVTVDGAVRAVCDFDPPQPVVVTAAAVPPPPPTWSVEQGAAIQSTLKAWLPSGWTLAWDTATEPVAASGFSFQGAPMSAIAELFDRRSVWADAELIACSFPKQKILQVRDAGPCGAP